MTPAQRKKLAAIDCETDDLAARLKWARAAQRAGKHGIADLVPPPGGWVGAAPRPLAHETPPARVNGKTIRYVEPQLPAALAHPDMAPFRLPAARAAKPTSSAKPTSAKPGRARASASAVDPDVAMQRGRRNAARKVAAALAGMK